MAHAPLHPDARSFLAREVGRAREIAEKGARASLTALAVAEKVVPSHFTEAQRRLRNRLRAHARQLGDELTAEGQQEVDLLSEEVAYQHWHRMLFARFLAENSLLREDEGDQPIDLDECRALAADRRLDIWVYAALCAQKMLPGVFRLDDPALELKLDGAAQVELNGLMAGLQPEIFKATDALGWVYQYWQAKRKDEVNASGVKIGAKEISPVTQLFTEDYMVDFLLHNTLGAWWAGKMGPIEAATEEEARAKAGLAAKNGLPAIVWNYLRFTQDAETKEWTPAGGAFEGWPNKAKDITFLDPCMGSGHFPVFALPILARMRLEEEGGTGVVNVHAVLKNQIHGLELDQRCCQIGAFNLALTAWKLAGLQHLPRLNVACCGNAPRAKIDDWTSLAGGNEVQQAGMRALYRSFKDAPILGSLVNPLISSGNLLEAGFEELRPIIDLAIAAEALDEAQMENAAVAQGLTAAAKILRNEFTLIATNVPYLGGSKQDDVLKKHAAEFYPDSKSDLATVFVERCLELCAHGGTSALVTPQNWLFLESYAALRRKLLKSSEINGVCRLGPKGFQTPMWDFNVMLFVCTHRKAETGHMYFGLSLESEPSYDRKISAITKEAVSRAPQDDQLSNPGATVTFGSAYSGARLSSYVKVAKGVCTGDRPRWVEGFWEQPSASEPWVFFKTSTKGVSLYDGCHEVLKWEGGRGDFYEAVKERLGGNVGAWIRGDEAWGKQGISVSRMAGLPTSVYLGEMFDDNCCALIPINPKDTSAILAFCQTDDFFNLVRELNQKLSVDNTYLKQVPFDLEYWSKVAAEKFPYGVPKPFSSEPNQWIFNGNPCKSDDPLQVAVARLLCYRWPRQTGSSFPDCSTLGPDGLEKHADDDGIVALSSINREEAAAPRLRALLKDAYGAEWRESVTERQLLADAGHADSTLDEWLRDSFFEEHCKLFDHRPFVWHIWDGERDGFHALVNYHRLAAPKGEGARLLQKLAQTYLGDWIARCEADMKNGKPNAYKLLKAAKELQVDLLKILEGEAPHDIFVRWKPLHEQAIGWNPDINDGVRLNIRPFLTVRDVGKKGAGVLRWKPNIKWDKDRGSEPQRPKAQFPWFWSCLPEDKPVHVTDFTGGAEFTGERWNNLHYTLAAKKAARAKFSPKK
jgi:hypothetical protein